MRTSLDYQHHIDAKRTAIPIPDLHNKRVLDIGCDHGYWSFMAVNKGASLVVGIDRNREVRGLGFRDLVAENNALAEQAEYSHCSFVNYDIGKQWPELGRFDVVFLFSLYHHLFANCGDHRAVWYWLWRHTEGELIWENPIDATDRVVQTCMSLEQRQRYNPAEIMKAATEFFECQDIGPAMHEETRWVYRFKPKPIGLLAWQDHGTVRAGAGGAAPAFLYAEGRRQKEIKHILGFMPYPGSLNLRMASPFDFDRCYVRAQVLDVVKRGQGLETEWAPRWCRFYPLTVKQIPCAAMRFEGETYPSTMVELVSPHRLRDHVITGEEVKLCRP